MRVKPRSHQTTEDVCVCASYAPRFVLRTSQKTSLIGPKISAKNEPFFSAFCLAFFSSVFSFFSLSLYIICPLFRLENMILKQIMAIENWLMRLIGRKQPPKAAAALPLASFLLGCSMPVSLLFSLLVCFFFFVSPI